MLHLFLIKKKVRRQILLFESVNVFQVAWSLGEASAVGNIILFGCDFCTFM